MASNVPVGWYPDPEDSTQQRYWDGTQWTERRGGAGREPTMPLPVGAQPPSSTPWWKKRWVQVTGGVLVVLVILGAIFGEDPEEESKKAADVPSSSPTPTVTVTAEPTPSKTPEPSETPTTEKPETTEAPAEGDSWTMPDEVGKDLQSAQDHIQEVTDRPFYVTLSEDATGQDRVQVLDRGWVVCSQNPAAGTKFDDTIDITFYVVKDDEKCP